MKKAKPDSTSMSSPPYPRSVLGMDPGLATFGCAHVRRSDQLWDQTGITPNYRLVSGRVYVPPSRMPEVTVAEENAVRVADLLRWLRPVLGQAVADGAESFAAERYEQLRQASAAAKYAAGHAALVAASSLCDPRPRLQAAGFGGPAYISGRDAKRAVTGCDVATKAVIISAAAKLVAGAGMAMRTLLASHRPHLADAIAVALCALGHRERVVMVGESGSVRAHEQAWRILGDDLASLEVQNLIPEPRAFEGSRTERIRPSFPMREAKVRALSLEPGFDGRAVIFVGARVAEAFEVVIDDPLAWNEVRCESGPAYMAAVLPDPVGSSKWWNDPKNVGRAKIFLRAAAKVA